MRFGAYALVAVIGVEPLSAQVRPEADASRTSEASLSSRQMPDGKLWMTENLRVSAPESYCYGDIETNCGRYGRLYRWRAAQRGCQSLGDGWRLPTNDEWQRLAKQFGGVVGDSDDGGKAAYRALVGGVSGFNALKGGGRSTTGEYTRAEAHGFFWTATESDSTRAWFYNFGGQLYLNRHPDGEKERAFSVRCVRDVGDRTPASGPAPAHRPIVIHLATGSEIEKQAKAQLERILTKWDLSKWFFTDTVRIESGVIPYSHPVLTLNTNGLSNDTAKAGSFVHEQLHWFLSRYHPRADSATRELRALYPNPPDASAGGAQDRESTYLHLLVGVLELDARRELFGEEAARRSLGRIPFYTWVYREVLERPEPIRALLWKYRLDTPDARK
jgi:uncharacterized protein (TIGR02145 family)